MDNKLKKDFLQGSAAATLGTISSMVFHMLSIMVLTRYLTKLDFGLYVILLVIAYFFNILSSLGLNVTIIKFLAGKERHELKASFRAIMGLRIIALIALTAIFLAFYNLILPLFDIHDYKYILAIPLLFVFTSFRDMLFNVLQSFNEYKKYAVIQISTALIRILTIVALVIFDAITLESVVYTEILTTFVSILIQSYYIKIHQLLDVKPEIGSYAGIIKFSAPIYANNILNVIHDRVSLFIIGIMLSPVSVAIYDVANKAPDALNRVFAAFTIVFFPNMSKLFSNGQRDQALELMNKSLNAVSAGLSIMVFFGFMFSNEIITLAFSSNYSESALAFGILMISLYFRVISNLQGYSLVSAGFSAIPVKTNVIASAVNLILSLSLIPFYGIMGAVYAICIMNAVSQLAYHIFLVKNNMPLEGLKYITPLLLAILFSVVPFIINIENLFIKGFIAVIYLIINWFFVGDIRKMILYTFSLIKKIKIKSKLITT